MPAVRSARSSCTQNVCSFDGRGSTDENATALTYSWTFGTGQGTGSGPIPSRPTQLQGTYVVTLTVRDEWNVNSAIYDTARDHDRRAGGNVAPVPTFLTSCLALACATSSFGTADANTGDTIAYLWNWGDGTATSTGTAPSHTYALQGTYTITLTTTDGWGKSASTTRIVTLTEPPSNAADGRFHAELRRAHVHDGVGRDRGP